MTTLNKEEHQRRLKQQQEKGIVLRGVILELHQNQMGIKAGMDDPQFVAKVISRIYHDRLVGVNNAIYDESLTLADRVKPYFTNENDATYGRAMAYRFGMTLTPEQAANYNILEYRGDMRIDLSGDALVNFVRYLKNLGAVVNTPKILPATDGVNHVNIYSKGVSTVGRVLSNFHTPNTPYETLHGSFASLEGYYHWLRVADYHCNYRNESIETLEIKYPELVDLRTANGGECIKLGRKCKATAYAKTSYRPGKFEGVFFEAYVDSLIKKLARVYTDDVTLGAYVSDLIASNFKLVHYYNTGTGIKYPPHGEWLPELITALCVNIDPAGTTDIVKELVELLPSIIGD